MNPIRSSRFLHPNEVSPFPPANPVDDQPDKPLPETYTAYTVWCVLIISLIAGGIIGGLAMFFAIAHLNGQTQDSPLPLPTHKAPVIDTRLPDTTPSPLLS